MSFHIAPPTTLHTKLKYARGTWLMVSNTFKTLGVVLDNGIIFYDHITYVSQVALGRMWGLYRYRHIQPKAPKLQLVQFQVLSVLCALFFYTTTVLPGKKCPSPENCRTLPCASLKAFVFESAYGPSGMLQGLMPMEAVCRMQPHPRVLGSAGASVPGGNTCCQQGRGSA